MNNNDSIVSKDRYTNWQNSVFDQQFWPNVVARLWADLNGDVALLRHQMVIVPDASMYLPFQAAWIAHAREHNVVCMMPRMMTLLDWAKSYGASDLDSDRVARIIAWTAQLKNTPQLLEWLSGSDDADIFAIATSMVELSDELSLHFLAGQELGAGDVALRTAIDAVYESQAQVLARQELDVLLQCWRADVAQQTPVIRYLSVLHDLIHHSPVTKVCVIRNRSWSQHEIWFWQAYAQVAEVLVFDVQKVAALRQDDAILIQNTWMDASERIIAPSHDLKATELGVIYVASHLEDEAQAIVRQVLKWRDEGKQKIALVALDRTVGRRVWALLGRCGVLIRDDTGWLLSTARMASSWQHGLELWLSETSVPLLLDWLSHPAVLAHIEVDKKRLLLDYLRGLLQQSKVVIRDWRTWFNWVRQNERISVDSQIRELAVEFFQKATEYKRIFSTAQTLSQWVNTIHSWADDFGLLISWQNDPAGEVWLKLLESWRNVQDHSPIELASLMRVIQSEVEQAKFRPHDAPDQVLLLPLGSTRMRDFDAVWLMGADANNLPNASSNTGLFNVHIRQTLGLLTYVEQQKQAQYDLMGLFARTPIVYASYCRTKDGAPNALSAWLVQWLRVSQRAPKVIERNLDTLIPQIAPRSRAGVADFVPHTISATDLSMLAVCPYQFYAKKILHLRQKDFASDGVDAAERGNLWHRIVVDFHQRRTGRTDIRQPTRESDIAQFNMCIEKHLNSLCEFNARYWVVREVFLTYVDAYVDWWRLRESDDWCVEQSEAWVSQLLNDVQWQGKIDQIDMREYTDPLTGETVHEYAIIDYKTGSVGKYQRDIVLQDDIQLAFYLNLLDTKKYKHLIQAGYIGVTDQPVKNKSEKPHTGDTSYPQAWLNPSQTTHDAESLNEAAHHLQTQVLKNFEDMANNQPLIAMGELTACQYCIARGLCRKGYTSWEEVS